MNYFVISMYRWLVLLLVYSDAEVVGNPMVMGFTDDIDDEDFRPSKVLNPVAQISDSSSSDEEERGPVLLQPKRASPVVNNVVVSNEASSGDELDDWLNGSGESKKNKAPQASKSKREEVLPDLEEAPVVNQKSERNKAKEKKSSKHKSKKTSKKSIEPSSNGNTESQLETSHNNEYEEI